VVIPGSRNDLSFIVQPVADRDDALWSLAHGAGRKIARNDAQGKLANLYRNRDIQQNQWGGRIICGERPLLWEEAPECYKDIATVIGDLVMFGLINVIATVRPLVTFKTSEGAKEMQRERKEWQRDRAAARSAKQRYR
jgi:release factor H-coupled RctB family protein